MKAPVHTDKPQPTGLRSHADRPQAASSAKSASKSASKAAGGKAASKAVKPPAKKAVAKKPAKPVKTGAKAASLPKAKGKPLAKAAPKSASKVAPKVAAKAAAKASQKPAVKAAPKAASKPASKVAAKIPPKASPKPVAKAVPKPAPKAAPKAPVKTVPKAVASKPVAKAVPKSLPPASAKSAPQAPAKASANALPAKAAQAVKTPAPAPAAPAPAAPEPTRKSKSRAALAVAHAPVVPTHSPDAAKASYVSATERTIAPPPTAAVIRKDPKLANNWKTKRPEDLTDEEVKSMPDSEYMNETQLAFFRLKLLKLKQDIHNSAGETTEHLREETVVVPDPADRATIEEEHALELRTRDRERKLLKKIEQSISRIDAGDYGYCDETGEPIGVGRLIARPTASLSLEAQQRRELKQKMFGD